MKTFYNLLQTYYACGDRLWELDLENKRWLEGPPIGAGIAWHALGPNLVGLGYHSAFGIADIMVDGVESVVEYEGTPSNRSENSPATRIPTLFYCSPSNGKQNWIFLSH